MRIFACVLLLPFLLLGPAETRRAGQAPTAEKRPRGALNLKLDGNVLLIVQSMPCTVTAPPGADFYMWNYPESVKASADENVLVVKDAPKGASTISVLSVTIDFQLDKDGKVRKEVKKETGSIVLTYGRGPDPKPPDPVPPDPPGPDDAPIKEPGFRVLIVYESAELTKMPSAQQSVLYAKSVRDYLNAKCVVGPDGKTREWRIWDADVDTSAESKIWQGAMKRPRKSLPWVLISNGKTGFEGALPADTTKAMELFKKYAETSTTRKGG
jgi:hypothetical protein